MDNQASAGMITTMYSKASNIYRQGFKKIKQKGGREGKKQGPPWEDIRELLCDSENWGRERIQAFVLISLGNAPYRWENDALRRSIPTGN